jgi:hypothetical protein
MLNHISWQAYWTCIAILVSLYYFFVIVKYWYQDMVKLVNRGFVFGRATPGNAVRPQISKDDSDTAPWEIEQDFQRPPESTLEHEVYVCMDEVNALLQEMKKQKCVKEELLFKLFEILRKYPLLRQSEFKESMSNVIMAECYSVCSVQVSPEEVGRLWSKG